MNLLTMVALAVLVPGTGADTEYADDVWVRVTSDHVEMLTVLEATEAVQKHEEGILVKCKSLKISVTSRKYRPDEMLTAENLPMKLKSRIIECLDCSSFTSAGMNGTAHSVVFNQGKGIVTLTGDDVTPVQLTIHSNGNGEQKIVSQSMQITIPNGKLAHTDPRPTQLPRLLQDAQKQDAQKTDNFSVRDANETEDRLREQDPVEPEQVRSLRIDPERLRQLKQGHEFEHQEFLERTERNGLDPDSEELKRLRVRAIQNHEPT
jgi:hypothetical protein